MHRVLNSTKGDLVDRFTQRWVQLTGELVSLREQNWLRGPVGASHGIGFDYFEESLRQNLLSRVSSDSSDGLLLDLSELESRDFRISEIHPAVRDFYEHTAEYTLDAWSEWNACFRPFGWLLALIFSRRLEQLNVPLRGLDSSHGMESKILKIEDNDGQRSVAWVRRLVRTGRVLYVGNYSTTSVPNHGSPCVKVVFPLPNGNAMVIMKVESHSDGSMSVISSGKQFGDPGFYFTVHSDCSGVRARYVRTMREQIRVYPAEAGVVRADHTLWIYGVNFLNLHYRMTRKPAAKGNGL
jgi:hypothetical protein